MIKDILIGSIIGIVSMMLLGIIFAYIATYFIKPVWGIKKRKDTTYTKDTVGSDDA